MTPQFLRDEAARFRGMAEDADRAATKERFLAIAADYDARSRIAIESEDPISGEAANELTEPNSGVAIGEAAEPISNETRKITLSKKVATGLKETVLIQRRPVGRPRRE